MYPMLRSLKERAVSALRRSEKYTKTDMVYLAQGGSWLTFGQLISTIAVFAVAVAFSHLVPKDVYGTYKFALAIVGILSITTLPGVNTYVAQAIARGAEGTFVAAIRARLLWGILGSVGALAGASYYAWNDNMQLASALAIAAVFIPFVETLGLYNTYLQSTRRFGQAIRFFVAVQLGSALSLIATMFLTTNVVILLLAYFVPPTLLRLYFLRKTLRTFPPNAELDTSAIGYGAHLSVIGVVGQIVSYIDTVLLFHFLGPIQVAIYSFALAPTEQMRALFSKNLPTLALPKMAQRSFIEIDRMLIRRMAFLAALGIAITLVYAVASPALYAFIFPQYLASVHYSQMLAALIVITLPSSLLATALQAKLHAIPPGWLYWAVVPDALHIGALIALLPVIGIWGVIVSKAIENLSAFVISLIQWYLLHRKNTSLEHAASDTR